MKQLFWKGYSLSARLFVALILGAALIIMDINYHAFSKIRYYLDALVTPLYYVSDSPRMMFDELSSLSESKKQLQSENAALKDELLYLKSNLLLLGNLQDENDSLRKLLGSPLKTQEYKKVAQVLLADTDPYVYQIVLDKGKNDNTYVGQPVVDDKGVVGQIYKTSPKTSRVILVCDYQHAIPVKIVRNNITMVAIGNGCNKDLLLDYLPNNVDIEVGDTLVTSGLDGRFPEGYPVGTVSSVKLDKSDSTPVISVTPAADIKRLRYLLLIWNNPKTQSDEQSSTEDQVITHE